MRKVIVLIILVAVMGFVAGQLAWIQVNVNGFGDANNFNSDSMAVYGNLYVVTENTTGTEVCKYEGTTWTKENVNGYGNTMGKRGRR